jgi:hypothetical protein
MASPLGAESARHTLIAALGQPGLGFSPELVGRPGSFAPERTGPLHLLDRAGTYGSLHLAEVQ